ncbi:uncharacterized protein [Drosophila pseudoobscura]|uniref:Uncharacterized protein n=2 Tax=Drosophila pseudoobscura TaxID=7237 RepID=A0A6I8UQ48_DROPS|nr:uncharacterized protein LOC4802153 [Drosophila pseudoobscura]
MKVSSGQKRESVAGKKANGEAECFTINKRAATTATPRSYNGQCRETLADSWRIDNAWTASGEEMCITNSSRPSSGRSCRAISPICHGFLFAWALILPCLDAAHGDELKASASVEHAPAAIPSLGLDNADSSLEQLIELKLNESSRRATQSNELLSRKRRYLVFPEGSSFQMVYDEIVGVVDHTNYLILGITVALAWELPSKPPSEELDDLLTKLEDGTLDISRNDTVSNITYVDDATETTTKATYYKPNYISISSGSVSGSGSGSNSYYSSSPVFHTPMHPSHQYADSYYSRPKGGRRKDNHYYYYNNRPGASSSNPFSKWSRPYSPAQNSRYPYWALSSRLKDRYYGQQTQQTAPPQAQRRQDPPTTTTRPTRKPAPRHHHIYPVFGKRSLPDAANPHQRQRRSGVASPHEDGISRLEQLQIKHHRRSRQSLYERIEKYLDKRGHPGYHCVLRTLCETGQKSKQDQEPGTFVGELMRAVFTIPEALDNEPVAYRDTHYDKAHASSGDCAALYPECKQSMWQAHFIQ